MWSNVIGSNGVRKNRITIESKDIFNLNVTSTLKELYYIVKDNWMQDLNKDPVSSSSKQLATSPAYRQRAPFIPFELKNDTGSILYFTTLIGKMDKSFRNNDYQQPSERWVKVAPGDTVPFTFKARGTFLFNHCVKKPVSVFFYR